MALDRPEVLNATKTLASFVQSPTKSAMANSSDRCASCWESLRQCGSTPGRTCRSTWMSTGTATGQATRSGTRSKTGVAVIFGAHPLDAAFDAIGGRVVQRGGRVLRLQPKRPPVDCKSATSWRRRDTM